jgi:hypothetical protein
MPLKQQLAESDDMKQRRISPDDTAPRDGDADARATPEHPPEDAECCALLRPLPAGRPTTARRPQRSRDAMNRAGRR